MNLTSHLAWIKQHYEKVILLVVLLGLTGSAALLGLSFPAKVQHMRTLGRPVGAREGQQVAAIDLDAYATGLAHLEAPARLGESTNLLYSSELRVYCLECGKWIEYRAETCPFCGREQPKLVTSPDVDTDGDGIPDVVETKWQLDPYDPRDAHLDHDGDGFTTLEEYLAKTDPSDPKSYPSIFVKLRLLSVRTQPFILRFNAVQKIAEDQERYQINMRTLERTYFARIGQIIEGYTVESFDRKNDTLVLRQGDTVRRLQRGKEIQDDQRTVQFMFLLDRSTHTCKVGDTFGIRGETVRVKEVLPGQKSVRIAVDPDGREYDIHMMTAEEQSTLTTSAAPTIGEGAPGAAQPDAQPNPAPDLQ